MENFKSVIGCEAVKAELDRILDIMKNREKYQKMGVKVPAGYLLSGDPGVGKTLIANEFMKASGRKCFVCRKNMSGSFFTSQIKRTFDEASQNQPSIILLDDMDKFANEDYHHKDAEEYVAIQACMDECKDLDVFVFATVNDMKKLPDSLVRAGRFGKMCKIERPTLQESEQILKYYLSSRQTIDEIDLKELAKILQGYTCAELESIINEAGIYACFANKEKIDMDDIIKACMRVLFNAPERISKDKQKYIKEVAYHEAGHAVVAEVLEPNSVNIVSVCKSEGDVGGVTSRYLEEGYWNDKEFMENQVMIMLGGKAATEIVYGTLDVGASSDLRRAVRITNRFIQEYAACGFDKLEVNFHSSPDLIAKQESAVASELERYYQKTKRIIAENRKFLDALTGALVEKQTLSTKEIQAIKASCK